MKKILNNFRSRTVWILVAIGFVISLIYGFVKEPFFLHFTDGIGVSGMFCLLFAVLRSGWKNGDFAMFNYKAVEGSFRDYRTRLIEERRDTPNPALYAAIILLAIGIALALIYQMV